MRASRCPPETAADLVAQCVRRGRRRHAIGVVHRDIKPGNLLVTPAGQVKITDFGIARAADAAGLTQTGQVIGTPAYFSPEQAEGKTATEASDVYSLGVVLYECLAGRRPFAGDTPIGTALAHLRERAAAAAGPVPRHLRDAVAVALAKTTRPTGSASGADFARVLRGGPMPAGLAGAARRRGRRGSGCGRRSRCGAADEGTRLLPTAGRAPAGPPRRRPHPPGPPPRKPGPVRGRPLAAVGRTAVPPSSSSSCWWPGSPGRRAGRHRWATRVLGADALVGGPDHASAEPTPTPTPEPSPTETEEPTEEPGIEIARRTTSG